MRSVRVLLVAFYVTLAVWLGSWAIADARGRLCNPDDLTQCDFVGNVLLASTLLLPLVLLPLLVFLCVATVALLNDRKASDWIRQLPVLAVIATLALLGATVVVAVFGNLEALV